MDDNGDYRPLTFEHGLNLVNFFAPVHTFTTKPEAGTIYEDGTKYNLKSNDDIIIYQLKNGKYEEICPFKDLKQIKDYEKSRHYEKMIDFLAIRKNNDQTTTINICPFEDLMNGNLKLYIKFSDFKNK